jgi:hypothetical protein
MISFGFSDGNPETEIPSSASMGLYWDRRIFDNRSQCGWGRKFDAARLVGVGDF